MAFNVKDWRDAANYAGGGDTSTPLSAAAIEDLEQRLSDYTDAQVAAAIATVNLTINAQTLSYTFVLADANCLIKMNSASARTVTVPPNSSVAFPIGTTIAVEREGAGTVTLVAGAGVTLNTPGGLAVAAQYGTVTAVKTATDTWVIGGLV